MDVPKMAKNFLSAHNDIKDMSDEQKVLFYKKTYADSEHSANESAMHFYAFGVAFLGFDISST